MSIWNLGRDSGHSMPKKEKQLDKWDLRFIDVAKLISSWSKDRSTVVGCVIVSPLRDIRVTGYNGFPRKVNDDIDTRHLRPAKYKYTEHAERNAIFAAARLGESLNGCTLYFYSEQGKAPFPCADCARAMIQAGISRLVCQKPDFANKQWAEDFAVALEMLKEAKIEINYW